MTKPLHLVGIGAHLDDCWLGFGGTALKALRCGHRVTFITAVTNFRKLPFLAGRDAEVLAFLENQSHQTGVRLIHLKHDYMRLECTPALIDEVAQLLLSLRPDIVFCHDTNESNQDHVALGRATLVAVRHTECFLPEGHPSVYLTGEIYQFTTGWQSQGFQPDTHIDISDTIFELLKLCSSVDVLYARGQGQTTLLTVSAPEPGSEPVALTSHSRYKFAQSIIEGRGSGYAEGFRSFLPVPLQQRRLLQAVTAV